MTWEKENWRGQVQAVLIWAVENSPGPFTIIEEPDDPRRDFRGLGLRGTNLNGKTSRWAVRIHNEHHAQAKALLQDLIGV